MNIADGYGGGLYSGSGTVIEVTGGDAIEYNKSAKDGGGIYFIGSQFKLDQKQVNYNTAQNGGGIYLGNNSKVNLVNMGLNGNVALNGAGLYREAALGNVDIQHATIQHNLAQGQGGGIYNVGSAMNVNASIIAANVATATASGGIQAINTVNVAHSLRWANEYVGSIISGTGNIENQDPLIRLDGWGIGGDLYNDSPAIDAVPSSASTTELDRFHDPRPLICAKDMGRDEFRVFRKLTWGAPDLSQQTSAAGKSIIYTYKLSNDSQNLTGEYPFVTYAAANGLGIGTGYTETVTVKLDSSKGWAELVENLDLDIPDGTAQATFELKSGQAITLQVRVTIPTDEPATVVGDNNTLDQTQLVAEGQYWNRSGPPRSCETLTGQDKDSSYTSRVVTTKVAEKLDFAIGPDNFGSALPGESMTYTHIVTNTGNAVNTFQLDAKAGFYARAEIVPTQLTLAPGQTATVKLKVTILEQSAGDLIDRSSAIVSYMPKGGKLLQTEASNNTHIGFTSGDRYVYFNGGRDSLVSEPDLEPEAVDLLDNNCTRWSVGPCATLEQALAQAAEGDVIKIAAGTYSHTLTILKSISLKGGYDNTRWLDDPPDHLNNPTLFDPSKNNENRAIYIAPGLNVTLDRLTIQNGQVMNLSEGGQNIGGNILSDGRSLTVRNCQISNGLAAQGAGLYSSGEILVVQNTLFHDNTATNEGGAIYAGSRVVIENNSFYQNGASQGSAIYLSYDPKSLESGVTNNIFAKNGNTAVYAASALVLDYNLYHNDGLGGGVTNGVHDVQGDPQFSDLAISPPDLNILATSPSIDQGNPSTNISTMPVDYANQPRRSGLVSRIDIGAYEVQVEPFFSFGPDTTTIVPIGSQKFITHILQNVGSTADTYQIQYSSSRGWGSLGQSEVSLASGQSKTIIVSLTVPETGLNLTDLTLITVTSTAHPESMARAIDTIIGGPAVPTSIKIEGPTIGHTNQNYIFTAKVSPDVVIFPITFTWKVDGQTTVVRQISSLTDTVSFSWNTQGRKSMTIIAQNNDGKTQANYSININDTITAQPPTQVEIVGATSGLINRAYTFKANVTPSNTAQPLTYQWQATGQTAINHTGKGLSDEVTFTWSKAGVYQLTLTVSNGVGTKSQTFEVTITNFAAPPLGVSISGATAGLINRPYSFIAHTTPLTTTQPLTYIWQVEGQPTQTHGGGIINDTAIFSWPNEGIVMVTVTVMNEAGSQTGTYQLLMTQVSAPPQSVVINGATVGLLDTAYNFTAQVLPNEATQPLTYTWQATDQTEVIQTNNLNDVVSFSWNSLGNKIVTVIAKNEAGSVAITHAINVKSSLVPQPPKRIKISGATAGLTDLPYIFKAEVSPATADQPLTYRWEATGQTAPIVHQDKGFSDEATFIWNAPGTYQLTLTVSNESGTTSQTFMVVITELPKPPLSVEITGATAGLINRPYTFTAHTAPLTTTQPLTYLWETDAQQTATHFEATIIDDAAPFTWNKAGTHFVTVTVMNESGTVSGTYQLIITKDAVPPIEVLIDGPEAGETNTDYIFTATVSSNEATQPLTYTWEAIEQPSEIHTHYLSDPIILNWATAGTKIIQVTAANDAASVENKFAFVVKAKKSLIYLPILLKGFTSPTTPTATPVNPTATSINPTATPINPTATPINPTATPINPTATSINPPTATPVNPTATSINPPTVTPVNPTATVQTATPMPTVTAVPLPDLILSDFTITALADGTYQVKITIRNQSAYSVGYGNNFWAAVYVDEIRPDTAPIITWGVQGDWLGAGQSWSAEKIVTAAEMGGRGTHTFTAWVDVWNYIPEPDDSFCVVPSFANCNNVKKLGSVVIAGTSGEIIPQAILPVGPLPTPTNVR